MKQKCKVCGEEKIKVKIGKRLTGSIFVGESGKEWSGRRCPECQIKNTNENMKKLRAQDA